VPEAFGGNMDTPEARAGTTIYLGVNVEGALFSIGDGHYVMGEGEVCGVAVEGAMDTVLTVDLIKGVHCAWPRLEDDEWIMVAGSYRPLEDAFRIAHTQLIGWICEATGLSVMDAYQLVTQASRSPIANVCDANYTIVAKMPKRYLPAVEWMADSHERLRGIGDAVRALRSA
jgi:acetamidase/formamidase